MKPTAASAATAAVLALTCMAAGCQRPAETSSRIASTSQGWMTPPVIEAVERTGGSLQVRGTAEPEARVVLRGSDGSAHAAAAGADGRFAVAVADRAADVLLTPELQIGQIAARGAGRLAVLRDGPVVVLNPGAASRRLDRAPALAAIDSDGRTTLASGRAAHPFEIQAGPTRRRVVPDADGRWRILLEPDEARDIRIGAQTWSWPGPATERPTDGLQVSRDAGGWRILWTGDGATQSTWLPSAAAR